MTVTKTEYPAADSAFVMRRCNWLREAEVARSWCEIRRIDAPPDVWCECVAVARDADDKGVEHTYLVRSYMIHDAINALTQLRRAVVAVEEVTR